MTIISLLFFLINNLSYSQKPKESFIVIETSIQISLYEQFELKFEACRDAGYYWYIEPFDTTKILLIDKSVRNKLYPKKTVGGFIIETWTFKGIQKGKYQLVFYYKRPWLSDIERKEYYTILIE